jgi:hypothetical protein
MSLSRRPNKFGLDPFLLVDTAQANYYYGRTDVHPDTKEGEAEALKDAAKGKDPELDRTLPWALLMGGMYGLIYREVEKEENRRRGRKKREPNQPLPRAINVKSFLWAEAFNIITAQYVKNGFFRRPQKVAERKLINGRKVALALLVQDPGKGAEKTRDYLSPERRQETIWKLRRMERHRLELGEDKDVQKHLTMLRSPAVN